MKRADALLPQATPFGTRPSDELEAGNAVSQIRKKFLRVKFVCTFCACCLAVTAGLAQETPPAKKPAQEEKEITKPATLPADALQFAAKLLDDTPESISKWCRQQTRKKLREGGPDKTQIEAAVARQYPNAEAKARDAAAFFIYYLGYLSASETQESAGARLRIVERDLDFPEGRTVTTQSGSRNRDEVLRETLRLEGEKVILTELVERTGKEVDKYLVVIAETYPQVKGAESTILRSLK